MFKMAFFFAVFVAHIQNLMCIRIIVLHCIESSTVDRCCHGSSSCHLASDRQPSRFQPGHGSTG